MNILNQLVQETAGAKYLYLEVFLLYREEEWLQIEESIEEWIDGFITSDEYLDLTEEEEYWSIFCISSFAEYMYLFLGKRPKTWGVEDMKKVCLELMPKHLNNEIEVFEAMGPVLYQFFSYLEGEEESPNAKSLKIAVKRIKNQIVVQAKDRSKWGISKISYFDIYSDGIADDSLEDPFDYDQEDSFEVPFKDPEKMADLFIQLGELLKLGGEMNDEDMEDLFSEMGQVDTFVPGGKHPLFEEEEEEIEEVEEVEEIEEDIDRRAQKTIVKDHQVGRNDPCPCGSGKKYKKCCL